MRAVLLSSGPVNKHFANVFFNSKMRRWGLSAAYVKLEKQMECLEEPSNSDDGASNKNKVIHLNMGARSEQTQGVDCS